MPSVHMREQKLGQVTRPAQHMSGDGWGWPGSPSSLVPALVLLTIPLTASSSKWGPAWQRGPSKKESVLTYKTHSQHFHSLFHALLVMTCNDSTWTDWKPSLTEIKSFLFSTSWPFLSILRIPASLSDAVSAGDILGSKMLILSHQIFSVGSVNGLIHDHILNLGGRKMLAKLQWSLIQSIAFGSCAGGGCWKYKLANPNTVKKWCLSQKSNRDDRDLHYSFFWDEST